MIANILHFDDVSAPPQRQAPHNIEAEQALLGAILINNEAYEKVSDFLDGSHFFEALHGHIYNIAAEVIRSGRNATPITLNSYFAHAAPVGALTVPQYLARLVAHATTVINAEDYGLTIQEAATLRALIAVGEKIVNDAYSPAADLRADEQVKAAEQSLYTIATRRDDARFTKFRTAIVGAVNQAEDAFNRRAEGGRALAGLSTGYRDLDEQLGGLRRGSMTILAGGTGMGKTTLGLNIAFNVAREGTPVSFIPREMTPQQLARKCISAYTGISTEDIERGRFDENQFEIILRAQHDLEELPIIFDGAPDVKDFQSGTARLIREQNVGLVVVDYLGLMQAAGHRGLYEKTTYISNTLKAALIGLEIPGLVLSQLSRAYWKSETKRPSISDLRDSGAVEQDADTIMFVHREIVVRQQEEPKPNTDAHTLWRAEMAELDGKAEVLVPKHRHGRTGVVHMLFDGARSCFMDRKAA